MKWYLEKCGDERGALHKAENQKAENQKAENQEAENQKAEK